VNGEAGSEKGGRGKGFSTEKIVRTGSKAEKQRVGVREGEKERER
jgi:hypothetical protein